MNEQTRENVLFHIVGRRQLTDEHYALARFIPGRDEDPYGDCDYDLYVFRYEGLRPVQFIGSDGGEPEDQTLGRDWAWVVPALNAAYELGRGAK